MNDDINRAFIDGQNLYLGTTSGDHPWKVDLYKFRNYLRYKYHVGKAYYFLGCIDENNQDLYDSIQDAGFIIIFRAHNAKQVSHKKGNVDTDIVFNMMKNFHECLDSSKFFLISGDGDYFKTVKYLCDNNRLGKVLFPARDKASFLYHKLDNSYYDYLDCSDVKRKIMLQ